MSYESWRISYQSSEQAARAAYAEVEALRAERDALARENEAMKRCAIKYLEWLGVTHMPLDQALYDDMHNPSMCGDAALVTQAPRACTCHPDDRPDGTCRERYAASECQALAATAPLQAEIDKLRREVEEWKSLAEAQVELRDEAEDHAEDLAKALAGLITWIPSADTYRRLGFDPEAPMRALKRAKLSLGGVRSA